jgi:hypothetical protein
MTLPTDFPGLAFWLRADDVILNGSGVLTWPDQTANGNDFQETVAPNQPPWNASDGGFPTAQPSVGPFITGSSSDLTYVGSNSYTPPYTLFIVSCVLAAQSNRFLWGSVRSGNLLSTSTGQHQFNCDQGGGTMLLSIVGSALGAAVTICVQDVPGGTNKLYVNSATPADSATAIAGTPPNLLYVGERSIGTLEASDVNFYNYGGRIAEVFAYNKLMLAGELALLGGYIQDRYGIAFAGATLARPIIGVGFGEGTARASVAGLMSATGATAAEAATQAKIGVAAGGPIKLELSDDELLEFALFDQEAP